MKVNQRRTTKQELGQTAAATYCSQEKTQSRQPAGLTVATVFKVVVVFTAVTLVTLVTLFTVVIVFYSSYGTYIGYSMYINYGTGRVLLIFFAQEDASAHLKQTVHM